MKYKAPESKPSFYIGDESGLDDSDYESESAPSSPYSPPSSPLHYRKHALKMTRELCAPTTSSSPHSSSSPAFQPHVEVEKLLQACPPPPIKPPSTTTPSLTRKSSSPVRSHGDLKSMVDAGKAKEVKLLLREASWMVDDPIRKELWVTLSGQHEASKTSLDGMYWETVKQIFGHTDLPMQAIALPSFMDNQQPFTYYLTTEGRRKAERVVTVIGYAYPDITYCPLVFPLACLLLHYLPEEPCYEALLTLLSAKHKRFITQTKLLHEVTWRTAMQLTKKFAKNAFVHLSRPLGREALEHMFQGWLGWIFRELPISHLLRVVDCYLHEGMKVLYRIAMAICILFWKHHTRVDAQEVEATFMRFCREMGNTVSPDKLLKTAFTIRHLRSKEISSIFLKTEMCLKSNSVICGSSQVQRSKSSENMPTSQSQLDIHMMSHTLTIREGATSPGAKVKSMGDYPIQNLKSSAVEHDCLLTLWSWLPVRITMYTPSLLYTTEEHGCSLTTFFGKVDGYEPTIMIVKTLTNEVFGAYLSTSWRERNCRDEHGSRQAYFGTGESFLFTLSPERRKFPWVGINQTKVDHGNELFMAADAHMLTIGGGGGQSIWLDENLRFGKTEPCTTFDNPPLCSRTDFEVKVVEVFGFKYDQQ